MGPSAAMLACRGEASFFHLFTPSCPCLGILTLACFLFVGVVGVNPSLASDPEVLAPPESLETPSEVAGVAIMEVMVLPSREVPQDLALALVASARGARPPTVATLVPMEQGLGFEAMTPDGLALRPEALSTFAFASSLLRSGETEQSFARGPPEELVVHLEAVAWQVYSYWELLSMCPATTWESVLTTSLVAPKARVLRSPRRTVLYSAMLFVVLNSRRVAKAARWPVGEMRTALAPAPLDPYALSVYIVHISWGRVSRGVVDGGVHSATKSARTYNLMVVQATNLTAKGASSIAHLHMHHVASRFQNMSPRGYEVRTVMSWARK